MVRARSWLELLDLLFAGAWNPALGRYRLPYAFRGHSLAEEDLSSGLLRLSAGREDVARLELHLLRNFRKYAHAEVGATSTWQWLALAQHRGLPTRLLDWTYSPFVALHFATANLTRMDQDGAVWAINFVEANRQLPARLKRILQKEGSDTATVDMLRSFDSLSRFDRLARRPFVVFLEPPSIDPRIVNQFALFSLMSSPAARLDDWLASQPALARRIIIPAALKWEIRDKLDQANINERVLFPGLDGLSRWLTRYYWPKPGPGETTTAADGRGTKSPSVPNSRTRAADRRVYPSADRRPRRRRRKPKG
jgi:hypothetical protein